MGGHDNRPREFTVVARAVGGIVSCSAFTVTGGRIILGADMGHANFDDVTVMDVSERRPWAIPAVATTSPQGEANQGNCPR
jgi:hypothetical protein